MTFPRVSRRGRHVANVGDVIIYPDLVVARTVCHKISSHVRFKVITPSVTLTDIKVQRLLIEDNFKSQKDLFGGHIVFRLSRDRERPSSSSSNPKS